MLWSRSRPTQKRGDSGSSSSSACIVVDPHTLILDPDPYPGFWPNLDPDPGLYYQLWKNKLNLEKNNFLLIKQVPEKQERKFLITFFFLQQKMVWWTTNIDKLYPDRQCISSLQQNWTFCCPVWAIALKLKVTQPAGLASLNSQQWYWHGTVYGRVQLLRALTLGAPRVHRSLNYS